MEIEYQCEEIINGKKISIADKISNRILRLKEKKSEVNQHLHRKQY